MKSIAEDLNVSEEKATEIYNAVLRNIPGLKRFMDESQEMARQLGYVEDKWGRRRYIPDMQLPPFEVTSVGTKNFDPFFDSEELGVVDDCERLKRKYLQEISQAKYKQQKEKIKLNAEKDGFKIKENTRKIEDAIRQCVNCVDKATQILTQSGWKTVDELIKNDIVQTYNLNNHQLEWQHLIDINKYYGQFNMFHIKKKGIDCLCTQEHKFLDISQETDKLIPLKSINQIITFTQNKRQRFVPTKIDKKDIKHVGTRDFVWCPTTPNGTWVAKRNNTVYITGNSRVQSSAASQSKIAMRLIATNPELKRLKFKMELLVHDEIIGEAPFVNVKEIEPIFQQCMLDSAKDLRTGAQCDCSCVQRWYGDEIEIEDLTMETLQKLKAQLYS